MRRWIPSSLLTSQKASQSSLSRDPPSTLPQRVIEDKGTQNSKEECLQVKGRLPSSSTEMLRNWLLHHKADPYPTEEEKSKFMQLTGLSLSQVCCFKMYLFPSYYFQINNWFSNARRRALNTEAGIKSI